MTRREIRSIVLWEETLGIKKEESMDYKVSKAVRSAFERLIHDIENEPGLILEGESQPVDEGNTLGEIRSWLFGRSKEDGSTDNSTDK